MRLPQPFRFAQIFADAFAKVFEKKKAKQSQEQKAKSSGPLTLQTLEDRLPTGSVLGILSGLSTLTVQPLAEVVGSEALTRPFTPTPDTNPTPLNLPPVDSNLSEAPNLPDIDEPKQSASSSNSNDPFEIQGLRLSGFDFSNLGNTESSNGVVHTNVELPSGGAAAQGTNNETGRFSNVGLNGSVSGDGSNDPKPADPSSSPISSSPENNSLASQSLLGDSENNNDSSETTLASREDGGTNGGEQYEAPMRFTGQSYSNLRMGFEVNRGQTDSRVDLLTRGAGYSLFLTRSEAVFALVGGQSAQAREGDATSPTSVGQNLTAVRMQLVGASEGGGPSVSGLLPTRSNYFVGGKSLSDVEVYSSAKYSDVYQGIDVVYYGTANKQLEYDFVVKAGADLTQIQLQFAGADRVSLQENGDLNIETGSGALTQSAPILYQYNERGEKSSVSGRFTLSDSGVVGFAVNGQYDTTRELYIDPVISFGAVIGGSGAEEALGVATDFNGNVYVTGSTASSDFPVTSGSYAGSTDAFVTKYQSDGTVLYSTFIGGSSTDEGHSIGVDPGGNAVVVGYTASSNFTTTSGAYKTSMAGTSDVFAVRLDATGSQMIYSTLLDGTATSTAIRTQAGTTYGTTGGHAAVAVSFGGAAYITGSTSNGSFPTTGGASQTTYGGGVSDAFLVHLNPLGTGVVFATFIGGAGDDYGYAVATNNTGDIAVGGSTYIFQPAPFFPANNFPTTTGAFQTVQQGGLPFPGGLDGWVGKYNVVGTLAYQSYLGGKGNEAVLGVAIDVFGKVTATGYTDAVGFPVTGGFGFGPSVAFLTQFNTTGSTLNFSNLFGGSGGASTYGRALVQDRFNQSLWLAGTIDGSGFTEIGAVQSGFGGGASDAFLMQVTSNGAGIPFSSYLGGSGADTGNAVAISPLGSDYRYGNVLIAGTTASSNFPVSHTVSGGSDAYVMGISNTPMKPTITGISTDSGYSATDGVTNDTTLSIFGSAVASSIVSVYLADVFLGTVTASGAGLWTYSYGTTLAAGRHVFTASSTVGSTVSFDSRPFYATVDTVAPTVNAYVYADTGDFSPEVLVSAYDETGLAPTTTFYIDVDLNNDSDFVDAGETSYTTGTLTDGYAWVTLPVLPSAATRGVRARLADLAGNTGTATYQTFAISSVTPWVLTPQYSASSAGSATPSESYDPLAWAKTGHVLDLDRSPGVTAGLVYDGGSVAVQPIIQTKLTTDASTALPSNIYAVLTWDGVAQSTVTFSTTGFDAGEILTLATQVNSAVTTAGRHTWSLTVSFPGGYGVSPVTTSGVMYLAPQDSSVFGAGWTFSGVDKLVSVSASSPYPAGMMRVYGTGEVEFYADAGSGNYTSPQGDNGKLVASGGGWTYTTPEGSVTTFDSSGYQTGWSSADGKETTSATYSSGNIATFTAVDGTISYFNYTSTLVTTITTLGRTVSLTNSTGKLTRITDADGGYHDFTYDGSGRLASETWAGDSTSYAYDGYGLLNSVTVGTGTEASTTTLVSESKAGLGTLAKGWIWATSTDPLGRTTRAQYDGKGRLLRSVSPMGGVQLWNRDSEGRVSSYTDELSRTTSYTRDALGYVTLETLPDSSTRSYTYQANAFGTSNEYHKQLTAVNELGKTTNFSYDSFGRLISTQDPEGVSSAVGYDSTTGLVTATFDDAGAVVNAYAYDGYRRTIAVTDANSKTVTYSYDANGNIETVTDANSKTTTFVNDALGRVTQTTLPKQLPSGSPVVIGTVAYDAKGRETSSTDANGVRSSVTRNTRGEVTRSVTAENTSDLAVNLWSYNLDSTLASFRDAVGWIDNYLYNPDGEEIGEQDLGDGSADYETVNLAGETTVETDENGYTTTFIRDLLGIVGTVVNALGDSTFTDYDAAQQPTEYTDEEGDTSYTTYNDAGQVETTTDAEGNVTTYAYNAFGQLEWVTDPLGFDTKYVYDASHRLSSVISAFGTSDETIATTTYYDETNLVHTQTDGINTTEYTYDSWGNTLTIKDALNQITTFGYNNLGQQITVTDATNKTTTYAYDAVGRVKAVTDANGKTTTSTYDALGRVVASTDARGNTTRFAFDDDGNQWLTTNPDGGQTWKYFNVANNLEMQYDPENNLSLWTYDALDRVSVEKDVFGKATTFTYYDDGTVNTITDRLGRVITRTYNDNNQLTLETWQNTTGGSIVGTLAYSYNDNGQVETASNAAGTYTFGYDDYGRLESQTDIYGIVTNYGYNDANERVNISDSLGGLETLVYDAEGNLSSIAATGFGAGGVQVTFAYNARNERTGESRFNASSSGTLISKTDFTYDNAGNIASLTHKSGAGTTLVSYVYAYNNVNNLSTETRNTVVTSFGYDSNDQVTSDGSATYTYDYNGNRSMSGYVESGNRITNDGVYTYTYDDVGNMTAKTQISNNETWTYTYDLRNQMTSAEQRTASGGGGTLLKHIDYVYDVYGNLVNQTTTVSGTPTTEYFAYRINGNGVGFTATVHDLWAEVNSTGSSIVARYLMGAGEAERLAKYDGSAVTWILQDRIGSVREVLDASGNVIATAKYDGFGNVVSSSGTIGRFTFAGLLSDSQSGLINAHWRWFNTGLGYWTTEDPLGFGAGDTNLRRYVGNNGVNGLDRNGLQIFKESPKVRPDGFDFMDEVIASHVKATNLKKQQDELAALQKELTEAQNTVERLLKTGRNNLSDDDYSLLLKAEGLVKARQPEVDVKKKLVEIHEAYDKVHTFLEKLKKNDKVNLQLRWVVKTDNEIKELWPLGLLALQDFVKQTGNNRNVCLVVGHGLPLITAAPANDDELIKRLTKDINARISIISCHGGQINKLFPESVQIGPLFYHENTCGLGDAIILFSKQIEEIEREIDLETGERKVNVFIYFGKDNFIQPKR